MKKEFDLFENTKSFEKHLEYHKRGKISDEIAPILFEKIGNPIIEKFKLALRERFREFCFHHKTIEAGKLPKFIFRFYNFEEAKMFKRLTDVELDIHLFDEFELSVYGIYFTKSKDELLDIRLNLVTEFCDCFSVVAEYLGYEVYIGANQITTFGDGENYFTFKKIA